MRVREMMHINCTAAGAVVNNRFYIEGTLMYMCRLQRRLYDLRTRMALLYGLSKLIIL